MAIMSIDETADMENGLVTPENVFKEFWPIQYLMPTYFPTNLYIERKQPSRVGGSLLCDVVSSFLCHTHTDGLPYVMWSAHFFVTHIQTVSPL